MARGPRENLHRSLKTTANETTLLPARGEGFRGGDPGQSGSMQRRLGPRADNLDCSDRRLRKDRAFFAAAAAHDSPPLRRRARLRQAATAAATTNARLQPAGAAQVAELGCGDGGGAGWKEARGGPGGEEHVVAADVAVDESPRVEVGKRQRHLRAG